MKDTERVLMAVSQKADGKMKWTVIDQNGVESLFKPKQITFIVPDIQVFHHTQISEFRGRAEINLDPSLLECARKKLWEKNKSATVGEVAENIYGCAEPKPEPHEIYSTHLLLSSDAIYFTVLETKSLISIYKPRSSIQRDAAEAAEKGFEKFICMIKSVKEMAVDAKPPKSTWRYDDDKKWDKIKSLHDFGTDNIVTDSQKKAAVMILKAMGLPKTSSAAVSLLIDIGYLPVHVNILLLKYNIRIHYPEVVLLDAENILSESTDLDKNNRIDLTHLKVYAIDVDEANELDDALSAERLHDGRIKVWIHVADPTIFLQPGTLTDKEAMERGTSVFIPTGAYPMFPEKLAMDGMSLKQGKKCNAVTVGIVLCSDGSVAEYSLDNSIIIPAYMFTYESASKLLRMNLEEETELGLLSEAAELRSKWRQGQGAIDTPKLNSRVKVMHPDDQDPSINLSVEDEADPAIKLVSEMMILCGEVIATYGSSNNIPLPYRGQTQSNVDVSAFAHLTEGPIRSAAIIRTIGAAEFNFKKPIRHGILGLLGYVQSTSPTRRYMDLIAHYQVKAYLRGDSPPYTSGELEEIASMVNTKTKLVKKVSKNSIRYWVLEYMRRQPKDRKYSALVLMFIKKSRRAIVLLIEIGLQATVLISAGVEVGEEVKLVVENSNPRDDFISLREVPGI